MTIQHGGHLLAAVTAVTRRPTVSVHHVSRMPNDSSEYDDGKHGSSATCKCVLVVD
jgi:hypothetical protein